MSADPSDRATAPRPGRPGRTPRPWLGLLLQLAVLAGLLALGARLLDLDQVRDAFRQASPPRTALFLALMLATRWVAAWRWKIVANDELGLETVTTPFLFRVGLLAEFSQLWLQSFVGGEAVRIWKIVQHTGDKRLGTGSVVLDRFVGTASLVLACAPALVAFVLVAPDLDLSVGAWRTLALLGLLLALGGGVAVWTVPLLRSLVRRAFAFLGERRFLAVPFLVSLTAYPLLVLAHRYGFPELAEGSWWVAAMIALLPRLGRAVPLSLFGLSAVEGSVLVVGAALGVASETLVLVVALNLLAKYLASSLGAVTELAVDGLRFFGRLRRTAPAGGGALVEELPDEPEGGPGP